MAMAWENVRLPDPYHLATVFFQMFPLRTTTEGLFLFALCGSQTPKIYGRPGPDAPGHGGQHHFCGFLRHSVAALAGGSNMACFMLMPWPLKFGGLFTPNFAKWPHPFRNPPKNPKSPRNHGWSPGLPATPGLHLGLRRLPHGQLPGLFVGRADAGGHGAGPHLGRADVGRGRVTGPVRRWLGLGWIGQEQCRNIFFPCFF